MFQNVKFKAMLRIVEFLFIRLIAAIKGEKIILARFYRSGCCEYSHGLLISKNPLEHSPNFIIQ